MQSFLKTDSALKFHILTESYKAMIKLINFSKKYNSKSCEIVKNVSFTVDNGITGLLGLNGAGKTTIIKAICAIHYPTAGKIIISNKNGVFFDVQENPDIAKALIGYVPEQPAFPENLTVIEYLSFSADLHGLKKDEKTEAVKRAVSECFLQEVLTSRISSLSKGYRQRLAFAGAIIFKPENLILDEPVNGLDPAQIIQFRKMIKNYAKNASVLISTHLMQEVNALCTNVNILSNGIIAASGTPKEIQEFYNSNTLEEAFLKITEKLKG